MKYSRRKLRKFGLVLRPVSGMSVWNTDAIPQRFHTNMIFNVFEDLSLIFSYIWSMFCEFSSYAKRKKKSQILTQLLWPTLLNNRHTSVNVGKGQGNFSNIFIKEKRNTNKTAPVFICCDDTVYNDKTGRGRWKSPHKFTEVAILSQTWQLDVIEKIS